MNPYRESELTPPPRKPFDWRKLVAGIALTWVILTIIALHVGAWALALIHSGPGWFAVVVVHFLSGICAVSLFVHTVEERP